MIVGDGVTVVIPAGVTLTDSGTIIFNAGDQVSFSYTPLCRSSSPTVAC